MFQSTPSGGKATAIPVPRSFRSTVSIHAFRGEGDLLHHPADRWNVVVSIHAFRGEGDITRICRRCGWTEFQSTPSGGKATWRVARRNAISAAFQSTPSGGKATLYCPIPLRRQMFQSTPSGGKATPIAAQRCCSRGVSIHAFRGEGDRGRGDFAALRRSFNPRLPGGRRPAESGIVPEGGGVSIHAFRGEGDPYEQR